MFVINQSLLPDWSPGGHNKCLLYIYMVSLNTKHVIGTQYYSAELYYVGNFNDSAYYALKCCCLYFPKCIKDLYKTVSSFGIKI